MIEKHIREWLLKNGQVIVPEFGGFYLYDVPSRYDGEKFQFIPASRKIRFDENDRFSNTTFLAEVSEKTGEEVATLHYYIGRILEQLRKEITNEGQYILEGLGAFRTDESFKLIFDSISLPSDANFGLPDITAPIINRDDDFSLINTPIIEELPLVFEADDIKDEIDEEEEEIINEVNPIGEETSIATDNPFAHWNYVHTDLNSAITEIESNEEVANETVESQVEVFTDDTDVSDKLIEEEVDYNNDEVVDAAESSNVEVEAENQLPIEIEEENLEVIESHIEVVSFDELPLVDEDSEEIENEDKTLQVDAIESGHAEKVVVVEEQITSANPEFYTPAHVKDVVVDKEDKSISVPVVLILVLIPIVILVGVYAYRDYLNKQTKTIEQLAIGEKVSDIPPVSTLPKDSLSAQSKDNEGEGTTAEKPERVEKAERVEKPERVEKAERVEKPNPVGKPVPVEKPKAKLVEKVSATMVSAPNASAAAGKYHLAIGSFGVEENANKLAASLKQKGYEALIIPPAEGKKLFKVVIGNFGNSAEAKAYAAKEQANFNEKLFVTR